MAIIRSTGSGEARTFERRLRIGRGDDNDLVLTHDTVSTFHAYIEWRKGGFFLRDLGSRNGTALDGTRVTDWTPLEVGIVVSFGPDCPWKVESLTPPAGNEEQPPLTLCSADGLVRHPVREDRFTIGRGRGFDLPLPGDDGRLVASVYLEDDRCFVVAMEAGAVALAGGPLAPGEPTELAPDRPFEVLGRSWALSVRTGLEGTATVEAMMTRRRYSHYRLELTQRGEIGDIAVHDGRSVHRFTEQELRFALLWVLADALVSGEENAGWVDDETLRTAIWGRRAAENQASSTLAKLIHDTRSMLARRGIDGLFIEKRRGRTRLRLSPEQVVLS
jgi:hypothetical protein